MLVARLLVAACAGLAAAAGGVEVARAEPPASGAASSPPSTSSSAPVLTDSTESSAIEATALDAVLPCGLRVLVARDLSLPVAAVVLAVEVGSEDDPPEQLGLVHALAYHLHQGNRELRPGEAIAAAQDAGGAHFLSTGPGQVRFESLVPISRLGEVLYVESQRLRAPTIDRGRWELSLGWAAADVRQPSRIRREVLAELHGTQGLLHDGRAVNKSLSGLVLGALGAQLASKFTYGRSTLIVVAPEEPAAVLEQVRKQFADLPPAQRSLPSRPPAPPRAPLPAAIGNTAEAAPGNPAQPASPAPAAAPGNPGTSPGAPPAATGKPSNAASAQPAAATGQPATAAVGTPTGKADLVPSTPPAATGNPSAATGKPPAFFLWPIPADTGAAAWAGALCRAVNRQKREADEPRKAKLTCDYEPDPRRGVLMIRPFGVDDTIGFVRARLARLADAEAPLLASQAAFVAQALRLRVRTPLGLARQLAASAASPAGPVPTDSPIVRPLDDLTGLEALAGRPTLTLAVEDALLVGPAETRP